MSKQIALVLGTARAERKSERVFTYLQELFNAKGLAEVTSVDVRDHISEAATIPPWGTGGTEEAPTEWQRIANDADIFVFILPEYNHGYPGEWKLLVDSLGSGVYEGKDVYIVGVSSGTFSGVRVADHVKPVLVELKMMPYKTALYIGNVEETFTEDGEPTDEAVRERATKFVDAVCGEA